MSKKNHYREPYEVLKKDVNTEPELKTVDIPVKAEKIKKGKVCDCSLLNVRKGPSLMADVEVVIQNGAEVDIVCAFKNPEFYKIITATKTEGYAMKNYIAIKE